MNDDRLLTSDQYSGLFPELVNVRSRNTIPVIGSRLLGQSLYAAYDCTGWCDFEYWTDISMPNSHHCHMWWSLLIDANEVIVAYMNVNFLQ